MFNGGILSPASEDRINVSRRRSRVASRLALATHQID